MHEDNYLKHKTEIEQYAKDTIRSCEEHELWMPTMTAITWHRLARSNNRSDAASSCILQDIAVHLWFLKATEHISLD